MRVWSGLGVCFFVFVMAASLFARPAMAEDETQSVVKAEPRDLGMLPFNADRASRRSDVSFPSFSQPLVSADEKAPPLQRIFQADMLGIQRAYLETMTGPAKYYNERSDKVEVYTYMVHSCEVTAYAHGDEIDGYSLHVTPACTFPLLPSDSGKGKLASLADLTMGDVANMMGGGGDPYGYCLNDLACGNSGTPSLGLVFPGVHANDEVTIAVTASEDDWGGDKVEAAAEQWVGAMSVSKDDEANQDYVGEETYNCDHRFDDAGRAAMKDAPVQYLFFGRMVEPDISLYVRCPDHNEAPAKQAPANPAKKK